MSAEPNTTPTAMPSAMPHAMIEARGLSEFYGDFVATKDVTFTVARGEIAAFLGPNGAGKSTTMKILSGFLAPSEGDAFIAGLDIRSQRIEASRRLGYLPENGPLYLEMTPLELLNFFAEARGMNVAQRKQRVDAVVKQTSLTQVLEKSIGKLSKGYRQRVGLAQALLHDPDVLIMDEPTAGLDPNQIRDFRANIVELGKSKTILLSTHILQEVYAVASRVIMINEGRVVFDGSSKELSSRGPLDETFHQLTVGGGSHVAQN